MSRPGLARAGSSVAVANKTIVLVTGGNTGIGLEVVKSLASLHSDYQILLGCNDVTKGEMAAASLGAPLNVNPLQLDMNDDESVDRAAKAIEQNFGRLDILINNAGTAGQDLTETVAHPRKLWQHVHNVNVISPGLLTERMTPLLQQSKSPKIIFVSSKTGSISGVLEAGKSYGPSLLPYNTSKSAVNMLAADYALRFPQFKVNACSVGEGASDTSGEGVADPTKDAVVVVKLATQMDVPTGTLVSDQGTIPW